MNLAEVELFRYLPAQVRRLVEQSFVPVQYEFGDVVVRQGDAADALFVIESGNARVIATTEAGQEVLINTIGPGDSFGEVGLVDSRAVRTASVRASSDLVAARLDGSVFRALLRTNPAIQRALALSTHIRSVTTFLRLQPAFVDLDVETLDAFAEALAPVSIGVGEEMPGRPGDLVVVEEGAVDVAGSNGDRPRRLRSGDVLTVGREALVAAAPARVLVLPAKAWKRLERRHPPLAGAVHGAAERHRSRALEIGVDVGEELLPAEAVAGPAVEVVEVDETAVARHRRRRRFPLVWQVDAADCGAASVAMVCRSFGRQVSLPRVREALRTGIDGTSLRAIANGSERLGLRAKTVKASKRSLASLPLPALLHWDGNHWVVLYDVSSSHVRIANPAVGLQRLPREEVIERWTGYAALLSPTPALQEVPEDSIGLTWLGPFFKPHRLMIAAALLLGLVVSGLQFSLPMFTRTIVDEVVVERDFHRLHVVLMAMIAAGLAMAVSAVGQRVLLTQTAVAVDGRALDDVSTRLFALPLKYFLSRRTGDVQRRLMGVRQARDFLVHSGTIAVNAVIELIVALVLMLTISRVLTLTYLAGLPLALVLMRVAGQRIRPVVDSLEESFGRYSSRQLDALRGIETVKSLAAEDTLRGQLVGEFRALAQRLFRADLLGMLYDAGVELLTFALLAVFLWVGTLQVLAGNLTIGGLVAFSALVGLANGPVSMLLMLWDQGQSASVLVNRLSDVFSSEPEQRDGGAVPALRGGVELSNLTFRYDPDAPPILDGINLRIAPGTTVAVVGRSGSGKTTLARCLAGLIEVTEGDIRYDGVSLRELDYRQLRRQIGVVLQESFLFADTIAANIAYGDDDPDIDRVVWAARVANAHDFVNRLPLAYDTRVGESGLLLSGGQKQRLAIARAIYHRPPVLILDEATSSLDAESERAVQENMDRLLQGRTSFVIAHRLSTIRNADLVIVIEQGRLVEQGTHAELMARQGLYYYLATEQLGV